MPLGLATGIGPRLNHTDSSSKASPRDHVVIGPQPTSLGIYDPRVAQLFEVMGERGLGDVEQGHELAHASLSGVLAQDIDELQSNGIAERLGDRRHV